MKKEDLIQLGLEEDKADQVINLHSKTVTELTELHASDKSAAVKDMLNNVDSRVMEFSGIQKKSDQKTSDYVIEAFNGFLQNKISDKEKLINELNDKIKTGVKDQDLVNRVEDMQKKLDEERTSFSDQLNKAQLELTKVKQDQLIKNAMPSLKSDLDKGYVDYLTKNAIDKLKANDKLELKIDSKGNSIVYDTVKYSNVLLSDYLKTELKDYIKAENTNSGTGFNANSTNQGVNNTVLDIKTDDTPGVKYQKITEHLNNKYKNPLDPEKPKEFLELKKKYILTT